MRTSIETLPTTLASIVFPMRVPNQYFVVFLKTGPNIHIGRSAVALPFKSSYSDTQSYHVSSTQAQLASAREAMRVATEQLAASERKLKNARQLRILIIGFGNFGQFISSEFVKQGHEVVGTSRGDYSKAAAEIGCAYTRDAAEALSHDPHVVVLCTGIMSTAAVLRGFPRERLAGRLVVDVLSVKEYPKHPPPLLASF